MKHKIHASLLSQLKTLMQNADAFEYQDQVDRVPSMPLVHYGLPNQC